MKNRGSMFNFAVLADGRRFSITLDIGRRNAQRATARWVSNSPNSSPIAISSDKSSTYLPAHGFSITATQPLASSADHRASHLVARLFEKSHDLTDLLSFSALSAIRPLL